MPMRTDCKNYESRTYPTGETVRKCNIDLAPEAPWRCPENCVGFAPRLADVNWAHGNLIAPPTPPEPPGLGAGAAERSFGIHNYIERPWGPGGASGG